MKFAPPALTAPRGLCLALALAVGFALAACVLAPSAPVRGSEESADDAPQGCDATPDAECTSGPPRAWQGDRYRP